MNKKKFFRKQQQKFMLFNFIAFSVIYTIFSFIIFTIVQGSLYLQVDNELNSTMDALVENDNRTLGLGFQPKKPLVEGRPINPNIIVVHWDENDEIENESQIGSTFYNSLKDVTVTPQLHNESVIENVTINNEYTYRSLVFDNPYFDRGKIQLLMNVDSEKAIIDRFGEILATFSVLFIIISLLSSYFLSRKIIKPIISSWNRQSRFVENASHELRTPLTIIQNKLELLLTRPNEKIIDRFEHIAVSLSETRRLSKLTTNLLTLARADSAETQLEKELIPIDSFIKKVCEPYLEVAELQEKQLELRLQANVKVSLDQNRLHQLIIILLDNALKFTTSQDHIYVMTSVLENKVVIKVCDTGMGISDGNKQYIFERFYREGKARSMEDGGTGLGLSIAKWIVDIHGGMIIVEDNKEKGTIFTIKLPLL